MFRRARWLNLKIAETSFAKVCITVQATERIERRGKAKYCHPKSEPGDVTPTSKKQMEKLNRVKKAKAEELSKEAAAGSKGAKKKLKKIEKKLK